MDRHRSLYKERIGRSFSSAFDAFQQQDEDALFNWEAFQEFVALKSAELQLGLAAFKAPSATSRSGMTSATKADGKKYSDNEVNLAKRLSDAVKLDESQALTYVEQLATETEIPETNSIETLLPQVIAIYWQDRSSILALLGALTKQAHDTESELDYKIDAVERMRSQSVPIIRKLLSQWSGLLSEEAPDYFASTQENMDSWIGQSLTEQSMLLEAMIAFSCAGTDDRTDLPGAVLPTLISTMFGAQERYRPKYKPDSVDKWEECRLLCVILSVSVLDLETLYTMSASDSYEKQHTFKSSSQVKLINDLLQKAERQQELAPFILAWSSVLSARISANINPSENSEICGVAGALAYVALETLDAFSYLHAVFGNAIFDRATRYSTTFKRIFFQFFELVLLDREPSVVKDFRGLTACLADVLRYESELCDLIWQDSPSLGQGTLQTLETARGRFPLQFEPLMCLLEALATGGEPSARNTNIYFHNLPTLTHFVSLSSPSIEVDVNPETRASIIRSVHDTPFGVLAHRPIMRLPSGMTGHLISAENAAQIVQWSHKSSGWGLCYAMLDVFRQQNQQDLSEESCVDLSQVTAIFNLLQALFRHRAVTTELMDFIMSGERGTSIIPVLFAILDQTSTFQNPPVEIIASCLQCLTRLCDSYSQDVWLYLRQAAFLPSAVTTTVQFSGPSKVQTSGLAKGILVKVERVQAKYEVTLALLRLARKLTQNAQDHELWDSKELRGLKSEVLYPFLAYIQNDIFTSYEGWHYQDIGNRFTIASEILGIFNLVLGDLSLLSASDDYINLNTLQDFLFQNFLYDGGKQLALPLVSIIGSGPDLSAYFSRYARTKEWEAIQLMVTHGLLFVKSLLRRRKINGGQPSFFEVYLVDRTVGRAGVSLLQVLASYNNFSCGQEAAHVATDVLTLLCSLTFEWKTRPSFVGYLGSSEEAHRLISTLVNRVGDDTQSPTYRISIWSLITITLTTQPGLATVFLHNDRSDPFTGSQDQAKEIGKRSVLFKALDILHKHEAVLESEPEILPHALHFLDVLWQNASDHSLLIKSLQENGSFWKDLGAILNRPDIHTKLELADWDNVSMQYDGDALVQAARVSSVNADQRLRGHALRIFGLAIHFHIATTKGAAEGGLEALPSGIKDFVKASTEKGSFIDWNETIPRIHYQVRGHRDLKEMSQHLQSPFDYLRLAVKRWDDVYDTDFLPGESFVLDLEQTRSKLIWRGMEREHAFVRTVLHANLNWSMVDSEMHRLAAWRFFVEVVTNNLGTSIWSSKKQGERGAGTYFHFVISLLDHIERDTQGSVILAKARENCCLLLQSVIENSAREKRSDKKNLALYFPEIVSKLQRLIQSRNMDVLESIQKPSDQGQTSAQALLLTILFCYRALHDSEVQSSLEPLFLEALQKSAILLVPLIANCFAVTAESHLQGQQDHSNNIVVLLALLEEICHPIWSPHPTLWIPILRNLDVFRLNLQLCARSVATADYENRPSFFEGSLNFLLALANVPEMAEYLADAGVMSMLAHNGLTPMIQRGEINHLDELHGDRGDWHHAWCMILATVTGLLRSLSLSDGFLQILVGCIQLYGNQLSKGLDTSTDRPLTSAKLEEMERITMLFYELSKHEARLEALGGGEVLKAYFDRSLFILQHATHLFTHPQTLSSVIVPITREELSSKEKCQSLTLLRLIEGKLAAVVRNILSAILAWTDPALVLTRSKIEWPVMKAMIAPISNTPVYEPASTGTLFDLVQYATTSLKEWEARLEGKTGGAAGLFKDSRDEDGKTDKNATSSTSATHSKTLSRLAAFGDLSTTTSLTASTFVGGSTTASGSLSPPGSNVAGGKGGDGGSGTGNGTGSSTSTSLASSTLSMVGVSKGSESAFATLSATTGSSLRMISLLEDALLVIATQLGLYLYHPQLDISARREIQDQSMDLVGVLGSVGRMLQRFENVPDQVRKEGSLLGSQAYEKIRSLRDEMIPILQNFAETKINIP